MTIEVSWLEVEAAPGLHLGITPASYSLTGSNVELVYVSAGTVEVSWLAVEPGGVVSLELIITPATYSLSGSNVTVLANRLIDASPGSYGVTGSNVTALADRLIDASPGLYDITGSNVTSLVDRLINASPGSYNINGLPVSLIRVGIAWPDPADVRFGIEYGPTGTEYVGTMRAGTVWLRRR